MTKSVESVCEILDWDSRFFGRRIARYTGLRCTAADAMAIETEVTARALDCVYILAAAADGASVASIEDVGGHLVDTRVTFGSRLESFGATTRAPAILIRPASESDLPVLKRIAAISHRDTRFYADGRFDRDRCDQLYATWIENSCRGFAAAVLVADSGGAPVGYVTCHVDASSTTGRIGLFGVDTPARGAGCGRALLDGAVAWFRSTGMAELTVATQLRNAGALAFYGRMGLTIVDTAYWFHLWRDEVDG